MRQARKLSRITAALTESRISLRFLPKVPTSLSWAAAVTVVRRSSQKRTGSWPSRSRMAAILRVFFYWYKVDEYIEVSDEVAAELMADKRFEFNCWRQAKRNKANYSLDADDGIENSICEFEPSPEEFMARAVTIQRLCCALNHLPPAQGRRIDAHFLLGLSVEEIAQAEGVSCRAVQISIDRGLEKMRKIF